MTVTQPVTLLLKDLLESPTVGFPRRAAGHPGCAEGNSAKMAFESSKKTYACASCGVQRTHFKLMASHRAEHAYKRECDDVVQYKRICTGCELNYRIKEFQSFSQEEKEEQPEYPTMEAVQKDLKLRNKGRMWVGTIKHLQEAKAEIKREREKENAPHKSVKEQRRSILARAKEMMARTLYECLTEGGLLDGISRAGRRMEEQEEYSKEYMRLFNEQQEDPGNLEKREAVEEAERKLAGMNDYHTCSIYGTESQPEYLKALDFVDKVTPRIRYFNVCRAKTGAWDNVRQCAGTCGLAFPAKMWYRFPNTWKYRCQVCWNPLLEEAAKNPDCKELQEWIEALQEKWGEDVSKWPAIGCGAIFKPWARGASMVVEMMTHDGKWISFMADRLPEQLDDAIKGHHAAFHMATLKMTPEELQEAIPMGFPMTHVVDGVPCVARYPIDMWELNGMPIMTTKGWAKLCMLIAQQDLENLQSVYDTAVKYGGKEPLNVIKEEGYEVVEGEV